MQKGGMLVNFPLRTPELIDGHLLPSRSPTYFPSLPLPHTFFLPPCTSSVTCTCTLCTQERGPSTPRVFCHTVILYEYSYIILKNSVDDNHCATNRCAPRAVFPRNPTPPGGRRNSISVKCHFCNQVGHVIAKCPVQRAQREERRNGGRQGGLLRRAVR